MSWYALHRTRCHNDNTFVFNNNYFTLKADTEVTNIGWLTPTVMVTNAPKVLAWVTQVHDLITLIFSVVNRFYSNFYFLLVFYLTLITSIIWHFDWKDRKVFVAFISLLSSVAYWSCWNSYKYWEFPLKTKANGCGFYRSTLAYNANNINAFKKRLDQHRQHHDFWAQTDETGSCSEVLRVNLV